MNISVIGSSSINVFAVSKFFKPGVGSVNHIVLDHGSQLWLDNAINEPAGDGLIAAIVFARQAHATQLLTRVASDSFGDIVRSVADEERVQMTGNLHTTQTHTDTTIHLQSIDLDQTTLHFTGSFLRFNKSDVNQLNENTDLIHIASLPSQKSILTKILAFAKKHNIEVTINPRFLHTLPTKMLLKLLRTCSIVVLNQDEANIFLGRTATAQESALALNHLGLKHVVIYNHHLSPIVAIGQQLYTPKYKPSPKAIDVSCVEAVFAASYIEQYSKNASIGLALTHALRQADSVKTVVGARSAILKQPALNTLKILSKDI